MSFLDLFHKEVNIQLAKHIKELNNLGVLPENWFWHRDKILELEKVDENLVDDLVKLHEKHKDNPEIYTKVLPLLQTLHKDLEIMLKQNPDAHLQKKETEIVNKLVDSIKKFSFQTDYTEAIKLLRGYGLDTDKNLELTSFLVERIEDCKNIKEQIKEKVDTLFTRMNLMQDRGVLTQDNWSYIIKIAEHTKENAPIIITMGLLKLQKAGILTQSNWPYIIRIVEHIKENAFYAIYYLPELQKAEILTPNNWQEITKKIVEIAEHTKDKSDIFFEMLPNILSIYKDILTQKMFYKTLDDFYKHTKLLSNPTNFFYWYELRKNNFENNSLGVFERIRLRKKNGFKEYFLRNMFLKRFGFEIDLKQHSNSLVLKLINTKEISAIKAKQILYYINNSKKQFPKDKTYYFQTVKGITVYKLESEIVVNLVINMVSICLTTKKRWSERHDKALEDFNGLINNKQKVVDMINFFRACVNTLLVFKEISGNFERLKKNEMKNKEISNFLDKFLEVVRQNRTGAGTKEELFNQKIEPLMDIIALLKSNLSEEKQTFSGLIIKTQKPQITDILDYDTTHCCAFYPYANNEGCLGYLEDDYIGLLQYFTVDKDKKPVNIWGVIIFAICEDKQKNTVLLIDSAEGDENYLRIMRNWQEIYRQVIKELAKDINAKYIFYGNDVGNTVPEEFLKYLDKENLQKTKIFITKKGDISKNRYLESFGGNVKPDGELNGFVEIIN